MQQKKLENYLVSFTKTWVTYYFHRQRIGLSVCEKLLDGGGEEIGLWWVNIIWQGVMTSVGKQTMFNINNSIV